LTAKFNFKIQCDSAKEDDNHTGDSTIRVETREMDEERDLGEAGNDGVSQDEARGQQGSSKCPSLDEVVPRKQFPEEEAITNPAESTENHPSQQQELSSHNFSIASSSQEDDGEDEEEEPLFKYQRLEGHIDKVFKNDNGSAFTTSEKLIVSANLV
jgi:hypothetical protein